MGKPGKLKSGSKDKLKKWAKGNSSSSNPQLRTHREKAKSRFFHQQPTSKPNKGLTMEALKIHDELGGDARSDNGVSMDDGSSEGAPTFRTFLSGLSDCTNVTFRKIQRHWLNNSAEHKEVCAVLAAITEIIRGQGGLESDTAYFAALVTALSSVEEVESAAAVAYLLSMTCKNVPVPVLKAKFGEVSKLLSDILRQNAVQSDGTAPTALLRSVLSCLATILRQQDRQVWDDSSTLNTYQSILSYVMHSKPKIRKSAQNAVCTILCASTFVVESHQTHPACITTAQFCCSQLEKLGGITSDPTVCHILALLGRILHCFPQSALKRSCETILRLMTLSDPVVKSVCLQAFHSMFINQSEHTTLTPDLNAQIITALYDYHPNTSDSQICPAWLTVMEKAITNLALNYETTNKAKSLALAHIPKLSAACFRMLLSSSTAVAESAAQTVNSVLKSCSSALMDTIDAGLEQEQEKFVLSMLKLVEGGLKYKYHGVWNLVFGIYQSVFQNIARLSHYSAVKPHLVSIVDLRNAPQFQYKSELDEAMGAAVAVFGPKLILEATPLMIDGSEKDYDFPRSWLLPLLKQYMAHGEILYFVDYFLPLAAKFRLRSAELRQEMRDTEATTYETLLQQCWDLLPQFCRGATDLKDGFPKIARILGKALTENKDLVLTVMQGLRNVILSCKNSPKEAEVVSRFAKNYIPILFNIYTTIDPLVEGQDMKQQLVDANKMKSQERLAALETIKLFLTVTDSKLICTYFSKAKQRVFDGENDNDATRLALLDIMVAMVTYITEDQIKDVYNTLIPMLASSNHSMQKKAYRLLEEICGSEKEACRHFVKTNLSELKIRLLDGLSTAAPSSKGPRINCIQQVLKQLFLNPATASESKEFLAAVIPEVILCTQDAKRSRTAAFSLLVNAANLCINGLDDEKLKQDALDSYFELVFTGFSGSPLAMRSTIFALSRLVYEFKDVMSSDLMSTTISNICLLLSSNTREVCKAALGFIMVLFTVLDRATFAQYTKDILDSLLNWKPETRRHFRFRVKKILQRLVKRFGFDTIYAMTPEQHRKQLQHIRKTEERIKKMKHEKKIAKKDKVEDSDEKKPKRETIDELLADSSDEEENDVKSKKSGKKKQSAWLQDSQEEPMDLLDSSVSQKVLGANPKTAGGRKRKAEFKSAPDGRLLIGGEESGSDDDEDDAETDKLLLGIGVGKQRKSQKKMEEEDDDDEPPEKRGSYKPGGRGIHRDVEATGEKFKSKKSGGDMKKKGGVQPYAYLPLDSSVLNKRKRKKAAGQYKGIVRAAKKGAESGAKLKSKMQKNKKHK
ncbi:RRP12-like protein [Ciona intestinalis]